MAGQDQRRPKSTEVRYSPKAGLSIQPALHPLNGECGEAGNVNRSSLCVIAMFAIVAM